MSNCKKILVGLAAILVISLVVYLVASYNGNKPYNQVKLDYSNTVVNNNLPTYYDTVLHVGLDAIGMKGTTVIVNRLPSSVKDRFNGELKAHVHYHQGAYYLFIDEYSRESVIEVIAHELVHVQQYNSGDLVYYGNDRLSWKGKEFNLLNIEYQERPWENEAFAVQGQIAKPILNSLY